MRERHCKPGFISSSIHRVTSFYKEQKISVSWAERTHRLAGKNETRWKAGSSYLFLNIIIQSIGLHPPGSVPPNSTQNIEQMPELVLATCRQWEPIQDNLHLFPKSDPKTEWLWHVSWTSWKTSVQLRCSARCFWCKLRRPHSLPDPQLLPEGQNDGTGTLGRPHHTWLGEAIS